MASDDPGRLPALFTYREAIEAGLSKRRLYALRDAGLIESVARGIFRRTDSGQSFDLDLGEIAMRLPSATLCLTSALVRHDLTDQNPVAVHLAIPAGSHRPAFEFPVKLHIFARKTFDIGRNTLPVGIGLLVPRVRRDSLRAERPDAFHGKLIKLIWVETGRVHGAHLSEG